MTRYQLIFVVSGMVFLGLVGVPRAAAQGQTGETQQTGRLDDKLFHFGVRACDGLTLEYHGLTSGTNFGFDPRLGNVLEQDPQSRELFHRYQNLNSAGNICLWGGVGVAIAGLFLPSWSGNSSSTLLNLSLGTVLTGLASSLVGALLLPASENQIARSAEAFNRDRLIPRGP